MARTDEKLSFTDIFSVFPFFPLAFSADRRYTARKPGGTDVDYFDDAHILLVMRHLFTAPPETDAPRFQTPSASSIEFIRSGHVLLFRNGKRLRLDAPALFWMRQGEPFRYAFPEEQKKASEHLYCDFGGSKAERMLAWLDDVCPGGVLRPADPEKVAEIFSEAVDYYRMDRELYHAEIVECLDRIMLEIARTLRGGAVKREDPYRIREIGDEIRKDPFRTFDFRKLAAKGGISPHHFRRLFRTAHGLPPAEFVRTQRMIRAAELLVMTDMRIKEIVFNCRFSGSMEFSRSFKRYAGMSPRAYRAKYRSRSAERA